MDRRSIEAEPDRRLPVYTPRVAAGSYLERALPVEGAPPGKHLQADDVAWQRPPVATPGSRASTESVAAEAAQPVPASGSEPSVPTEAPGTVVATTAHVRPYNRRVFTELARPVDLAVALLVFGTVFVVDSANAMPAGLEQFVSVRLSLGNVLTLGAFLIAWELLFLLFGLYDAAVPRRLGSEAPSVAAACTLGCALALAPALSGAGGTFDAVVVLQAWPLTIGATLLARYLLRQIAERLAATAVRRVVVVGTGPLALRLYRVVVEDSQSGYELVGFVDSNPHLRHAAVRDHLIGTLDDLERILMLTVVDEVLIALPMKSHYADIQRVIEECERAGVQSRYSADVFPVRLARPCLEPSSGDAAVTMKVVIDDYRLAVKRAVDIVVATVGLVLFAPLLAAIAVAVKVGSPGPVLFGQERYGWRKRRFTMWKFRTMVTDAEALQSALESRNEAVGPVFKIRDDPRITPLGRLLRRTSLDELPQLWNVLRGDMSLVGPRPLPMRDVNRFESAALMRRFSVPPGITGLWQVSGRSNLSFDDWINLDLRYIDRWSLRLDFSILLRTLPAVLRGTGAT